MACGLGDVGCEFTQAITGIIAPYVLPLIVLLVALLILPKAGKRGWAAALVVVSIVAWWYIGIPGLLAPLRGSFGA